MNINNAWIHYDKLIQPFLHEVKDRLDLMSLPPYNTEHNLIEGLWILLKPYVINNMFFVSLTRVRVLVQKFMEI